MRTIGVDLAAAPRGTAVAALDWSAGTAVVASVSVGQDDDAIVSASRGADSVGVDCPLGWPVPFVEFVRAVRDGCAPAVDASDPHWRRGLTLRATDLACIRFTQEHLGRAVRPLSASADLLGHVAMRCAVLQRRLAQAGIVVDRSGTTGRLVEVYPAASLALWNVAGASYKGTARRASLATALQRLVSAAPWLQWPEPALRACKCSDHAFDAVVAALAARAVAIGRATAPTSPEQLALARAEGWIRLPECSLPELPQDG